MKEKKKTPKNIKKLEKNNMFIWILFIVLIILVLLFPKIYDYVETLKLPKVEHEKIKENIEIKEIDEETLESIHYPLMRNSIYNANTYYSLDKFTISNMSNEDILLTAFLDIYEGNMTSFETTGYCTNISKQFNIEYLDLRIKNILSKNLNYSLTNFYVSEGLGSNYIGEWIYDGSNSRYIYNGLCNSQVNTVKYFDLEEFVKAEYSGDDIIVYYYVGFAKLEGNTYTIYNDAKMTKEILTGNVNNSSELINIFKSINKKDKKIYKYTFKNTLCSYNEYCLYEGEWINGF